MAPSVNPITTRRNQIYRQIVEDPLWVPRNELEHRFFTEFRGKDNAGAAGDRISSDRGPVYELSINAP